MKELTVIQFSADDRFKSKESGSKDSYNSELGAYTNNGIPEGDIEITANEIDLKTLNPNIMRALNDRFNARMTARALRIKADRVRDDDGRNM